MCQLQEHEKSQTYEFYHEYLPDLFKYSCRKFILWLNSFFLAVGSNNKFQTKNMKCVNCRNMKKAREFSFCMNTNMNMVSTYAKNQRSSCFNFSAIDTFLFFCLKHVICPCNQKKRNEARALIFCKSIQMDLVGVHVKTHRSSYFHVPAIGTFHI